MCIAALVLAFASQSIGPDTALAKFDAAIAAYMAFHERLRAEVPPHRPNVSAKELNDTADRLAAAIRRGRPRAKQGDFFDGGAARVIRQRIRDALRAPTTRAAVASIDDEETPKGAPRVYLRFPEGAEMATMPPSILNVLPPLPRELEYRIVGEYLVLRDVGAALVLDYIPGAVPRK